MAKKKDSESRSTDVENALREENQRLSLFLEHVGGALALIDKDCRITWTNEASKRHFGITDDVIGGYCKDLVPTTDEQCAGCVIRRAFVTGQIESRITERYAPSCNMRHYQVIASPILDSKGKVIQVMLLAQDVTELYMTEKELQQKTEMLEIQNRKVLEAVAQKHRFFASISHDLRAPLTAIIGFTEILLEEAKGPINAVQKDMLARVKQNANRLLGMVNNLLDLSKLESGQITVDRSPVNLSSLIGDTIEAMMPLLKNKDIVLSMEIADGLPAINTDEQKLSRILINLLSNAVKFTSYGRITIRAQKNDGYMSITVSDTGIGIRQADFKRIFEEFKTVGGQGTRSSGTGLGLAITRKLVHLLGGEIHVESKPGEGSSFTFTLPLTTSHTDG